MAVRSPADPKLESPAEPALRTATSWISPLAPWPLWLLLYSANAKCSQPANALPAPGRRMSNELNNSAQAMP
eukprot:3863727-Alexandrium_andersonii.AAC.1